MAVLPVMAWAGLVYLSFGDGALTDHPEDLVRALAIIGIGAAAAVGFRAWRLWVRSRKADKVLAQVRGKLQAADHLSEAERMAYEQVAMAEGLREAGVCVSPVASAGMLSSQDEVLAYHTRDARELLRPAERVEHPVSVGLAYSAPGVLVSLLVGACAAASADRETTTPWLVAGGLGAVSVCIAFTYSFVAWQWGKGRARLVAGILISAAALAGIAVLWAHI
jgi:hypothetical protein